MQHTSVTFSSIVNLKIWGMMCLRVYFGSNWYGAKPNYLPGYQSLALKKQVWVSQASEELQAKLILLYFASLEAVKHQHGVASKWRWLWYLKDIQGIWIFWKRRIWQNEVNIFQRQVSSRAASNSHPDTCNPSTYINPDLNLGTGQHIIN